MAKNKTQKKDKDTYRPWRKQTNTCIGCGRGLTSDDENICITCIERIDKGYDIW